MSNYMTVHKNRTNVVEVDLGYDISRESFTSEIRLEPGENSPLLGVWDVSFATDGKDGRLVLVMSDLVTGRIVPDIGFMDLKRNSNGVVLPVFSEPLLINFLGTVTK